MYYPKSQIKSNLYTNGEEYVYASDKTVYTGYYYTTSDGKAFSGKEPNSGVNVRLISYSSTTGNEEISQPINSTSEIIRSTINATGDPFADDILYKNYVDNTSNYPKLKNYKPRKIPNQYLRRPQKEDVKLGGRLRTAYGVWLLLPSFSPAGLCRSLACRHCIVTRPLLP